MFHMCIRRYKKSHIYIQERALKKVRPVNETSALCVQIRRSTLAWPDVVVRTAQALRRHSILEN